MAGARSKSQEAYASNYKTTMRWKANRKRKLERQLELFPNNSEQILKAIDAMVYRRNVPKEKFWSKTRIRKAKLLKEFLGTCPRNLLAQDPKLVQATYANIPERVYDVKYDAKVDFSIQYRISNPSGSR